MQSCKDKEKDIVCVRKWIGGEMEFNLGFREKKKSTQHKINVVYSCARNNIGWV